MGKKAILLLILVSLTSSCSTDWNIADSGLGDKAPASYNPGGEIINDGGVSDDQSSNSPPGNNNNTGSSSSSTKYDPKATPPRIDSPIMESAWREFTDAPIKNSPGDRSLNAYLAVLLQFDVQNSYKCRYTSACGGTSDTRCNIYASDVMNAMGAPLPTKGDLGVGHGNSKYTDPMPANAKDTHAWLEKQQDGWRKLDPKNPSDWAVLIAHVAAGKPALASHPDHIAVIRPDQPGNLTVGDVGNLRIAQTGLYNSDDTWIQKAFANRVVGIYIHD